MYCLGYQGLINALRGEDMPVTEPVMGRRPSSSLASQPESQVWTSCHCRGLCSCCQTELSKRLEKTGRALCRSPTQLPTPRAAVRLCTCHIQSRRCDGSLWLLLLVAWLL